MNPLTVRPTEYRKAEDDDDPLPGGTEKRATQFGAGDIVAERYRLIRKLGQGGMGVVWVAHSLALRVDVAIKLIRTGVADADLALRMAREAQATATLGHPAIVRVFDFGTTANGDPFLVMELAHGETLAALLRREGKLPAVQAVQLLLPLLDGLRCAHEHGIVHRDFKPENVFIARDAFGRVQPKLLDFGIAKLEHAVSPLTQVGEVLGSPEFMSPEQARGSSDIDARTDVWSTCVVLYEILTGTLPFKVVNYNALMQAILHEPPVPTVELGVADRALWLVIEKGLAKSRDKRWRSMTELGEALAFWLYDHGIAEDVAGNSVKAQWLGGTLTGVSAEARPDASAPAERATPRGLPTVRLKFRRFRYRAQRALTPAVLLAGALTLAVFVFAAVRFASHSEVTAQPEAARPAGSADAAPAANVPASVSAPPVATAGIEVAGKASKSKAVPSASTRAPNQRVKAGAPARSSQKPRSSGQASTKSIRDFGF